MKESAREETPGRHGHEIHKDKAEETFLFGQSEDTYERSEAIENGRDDNKSEYG
jgi:hypothetical protein